MKKILSLSLLGLGCTLAIQQTGPTIPYTVDYSPKVLSVLAPIYNDLTREIPFCMQGNRNGKSYLVTDLKITQILNTDSTSSRFYKCKPEKGYLGLIHQHSDGDCRLSETDFKRFISDEKAELESIVCGVAMSNDSIPNNVKISTMFKNLLTKEMIEKYK